MSSFSQLNFKHGAAKLQSGSSSQLCLTSNDGGEILVQSATTGEYIPIALSPAGINQECFNHTANIMGVPNQSLQANTLYSCYLRNTNGLENGCHHEFYPTFQGFNPTIDPNGLYVGNTGGINIGLMYLGQLWTGNSNISTIISPAEHMQQPCYSHFNPWTFGFQTTITQVNAFNAGMSGVQSSPSILTVSEGISESPEFTGFLNFYGNDPSTIGGFVTYCIEVSGMSIDGAWNVRSPVQYFTLTKDNAWYSLTANWMSAPPIGVYTARPVITYSGGGSILYRTQLLGKLAL